MPTRMIAAVLAAAACTTTLATSAGSAVAESDDPAPAPTLADVLLSDGNQFDANPFDYDIVTEAVLLFPDLVAAASDPNAELTVFLPNDWAFRKLVADLTGRWPLREQAVFDAVAALGTRDRRDRAAVPHRPRPAHLVRGRHAVRRRRAHDAPRRDDRGRRGRALVESGATDRQRPRCSRPRESFIPKWAARRPTASPTASTACCDRSTSDQARRSPTSQALGGRAPACRPGSIVRWSDEFR